MNQKSLLACLTAITLCAHSLFATPTDIFVSPQGDNSNPGSETSPLETIREAVNQMVSGDSIILMPGTHKISAPIDLTVSGSVKSLSYHNTGQSSAVKDVIIDGSYEQFRVPQTDPALQDWILVSASLGLWKSSDQFDDGAVDGYFQGFDSVFYHLVPYTVYHAMIANTLDYRSDGKFFIGPGIHNRIEGEGISEEQQNRRIYVRLGKGTFASNLPNWPLDDNSVTVDDPNKVPMFVFPRHDLFEVRAPGWSFSDIKFQYGTTFVHCYYEDDLTIKHCEMMGGKHPVIVRSCNHCRIDDCTIIDNIPQYISWTDVKTGIHPVAQELEGRAILFVSECSDVEVTNCNVEGTFDGMAASFGTNHDFFDSRQYLQG